MGEPGGETEPTVLLEAHSQVRDPVSYAFADCCGQIVAYQPEEVRPALAAVEEVVARGVHAAGFIAYEAAAGLEPALATQGTSGAPLLWFGIFERRLEVEAGTLQTQGEYSLSPWRSSLPQAAYNQRLAAIRDYIEAGDTYQVNFTLRLEADFRGDEGTLYRDLCRAQQTSYSAYLDIGRYCILSASPELFFSLENGVLTSRPMKGTRPRGRWPAEDEELAEVLRLSVKDRAENVMIVDLLRNDLGRVAESGSVEVVRLWEVERYETILQLTSTVQARLRADLGLVDILRALFPCGSVTGAPKVRTMQIIAALEERPRGVYTGCIGYVSPGLEARFNVAIRTVWIDREQGRAEFGVGGGITWDSQQQGEYEECLIKARVLSTRRPEFGLLETLLYEAGGGYFLLERHLERLRNSACYFGFRYNPGMVEQKLEKEAESFSVGSYRVRLVLSCDGRIEVHSNPIQQAPEAPFKVVVASQPVDEQDPFLFHKTTHRQVYERRLAAHPSCDDVILQNTRGELTECCIGNLVAKLDGQKWTPPVECGLLAGTFRAELLARGQIRERKLKLEDLTASEELYLINSVRRWVPIKVVSKIEEEDHVPHGGS